MKVKPKRWETVVQIGIALFCAAAMLYQWLVGANIEWTVFIYRGGF